MQTRAWFLVAVVLVAGVWGQFSQNDMLSSECQTRADASGQPNPANSTISLRYSVSQLRCADDFNSTVYGPKALGCSSVYTSTYTRFVFDVPSRSDETLGTRASTDVCYIGYSYFRDEEQQGDQCLVNADQCKSVLCSKIQTLPIRLASSPVRLVYNLVPLPGLVPFSYFPVDNTQADLCNGTAFVPGTQCQLASAQQSNVAGACGSDESILATYGTTFNLTQSCGADSDPGAGFATGQNCQTQCIKCGAQQTAHQRWLQSPICVAYRLEGKISWDAMLAVSVGNGTSARTVFFDTLNSGDVKLSNDTTVRVSLVQNYLAQYQSSFSKVDGYVFACNYKDPSAGNPVDQGLVNPYLNLTQRVQQALAQAGGDPWKLLLSNQVFFPIGSLTAQELGSGKVPTYNSTGSISWFFVPSALAAPRKDTYAMTQDQVLGLLEYVNLAACNADPVECWGNIPGWGLNNSVVGSPSLCQLSSGINQYAAAFAAAYASGPTAGNATASVPPGPLPVGLFPGYNIANPAIWLNGGRVLVDPGATRRVVSAFSIAVDVSDELLTFVDASTGVQTSNGDNVCVVERRAGNGTLQATYFNDNPTGSSPVSLFLTVSCTITGGNTTDATVTATLSGGGNQVVVPAQEGRQVTFLLSLAKFNSKDPVCTITASYATGCQLPPVVNGPVACRAVIYSYAPESEPGPEAGWSTTGIVVFSIVIAIIVAVIIALVLTVVLVRPKQD